MKVRVGRVVLAQIGLSVLALLAFTLSFASPSAAAPPLDRLISITIQSDIIGYYASALNRAPDQWGYNIHVHNAAALMTRRWLP